MSDWTFDRVHELCEAGQYENAYALRREFMEWMDAEREDEIDVCSIEYIED